ncbi:hypothetical protein, partial [Micromonospora sp. KC721]|uniref:hypothetical protein n=1 Tax=Micromonospora sp. KC721 TaxID=2530380 RepID=UPI0010434D11
MASPAVHQRPKRGVAATTATLALASAGVATVLIPPTALAADRAETTGNATLGATITPSTVDPRHWRRGTSGRPASAQGRTRAATEDLATLRVLVRDRLGAAPSTERASYALAFDLASGDLTVVALTDGEGTAQVAAGSYLVQSFVETVEHAGMSLSMPMDTLVTVDGSASAVLDARDTARVGASVDRPDARLVAGTVQVTRSTPGQEIWYAADFDYPAGLYVKPTGPVEGLDLNVYAALSQNGSRTSPYLYHLTFEAADGIPDRPQFTARSRELAAVSIRINGQNAGGCGRIGARGRDPELPAGFGASVTVGAVPGSYQAYFTPGTEIQWTPSAEILP